MRIQYSCCQIGFAACYVDYRPVTVTCDNDFGPAPLTVAFGSEAPGSTVTGCDWDFGDGETSPDPDPTHIYEQPGCYTVTLTVNTTDGDLTKVCPNLISAHADTLTAETVEVFEGGPVRMDVLASNRLPLDDLTIPFCWEGSFFLEYDSFSVAGCRTDYFDQPLTISYDVNNDRAAIVLRAGSEAPLAPGQGRVATLWFTVPDGVSGINPVELVSYGRYSPQFQSGDQEYVPWLIDGLFHSGVGLNCCEGRVGDANSSGEDEPTIGDITFLIDHLFVSGVNLECIEEADVNQSGGRLPTNDDITIGDITYLIDYLFVSEIALPDCL